MNQIKGTFLKNLNFETSKICNAFELENDFTRKIYPKFIALETFQFSKAFISDNET